MKLSVEENLVDKPRTPLQTAGRAILRAIVLIPFLATTSCVTLEDLTKSDTSTATTQNAPPPRNEAGALSLKGVSLLRENKFKEASKVFNQALKLDARNSYLQLLNGLTYHMQAVRSDQSMFSLAEQGYKLALKFDQSNWIARYQLGLLHLDQRRFDLAKAEFADALFYKDDDPDILYNLAISSYYNQDPETAAGALKRLRELEPKSARSNRASSLVSAALGNKEDSNKFLALYKDTKPRPSRLVHLTRRLQDWKRVHVRAQNASFRAPLPTRPQNGPVQLAQSPSGDPNQGQDGRQDQNQDQQQDQDAADGQQQDGQAGGAGGANDKMVVVDVVIISSREDITTSKGRNLLALLSINGDFTNNRVDTRNEFNPTNNTVVTTITRNFSIPALSYSLNIVNAGSTRNEILARPSLVAISGQKSEFFSGENIKAATVSTTAQQGSTEVDKDIGVKLGVTPTFLADGRVKLQVEIERTFLTSQSADVNYANQLRTTKESVNANVLMNNGETLILSGLSEKETENVRGGVPGLQDIPGVQYFFSNESTRDFNKSVLILLTPRIPEYTFRPREVREKEEAARKDGGQVLNELKARYTDWFRPYPNWASVFRHLQQNALYRQFRTGDVSLERWDTQKNIEGRLSGALQFLHF